MASSDSHPIIPLIRQFSKQIAGHAMEKGSSSPGMMKHVDGCLLKPILAPPRGLRELQFYEIAFDEKCSDDIILLLRPLLPSFHGVFKVEAEDKVYIKLEDLTEKFKGHPCILDLKMGAKTYDFEASEAKIKREENKYKETKAFGFCIPGMQVFQISSQTYICNGKEFGKRLTKDTIVDAFHLYLNSDVGVNKWIIKSFLLRLTRIRDWFEMQSQFAFFASSLLLIYDADSVKDKLLDVDFRADENHAQAIVTEDTTVVQQRIGSGDSNPLAAASSVESASAVMSSASGDASGVVTSSLCSLNSCRELDERALLDLTEVRMIDFAHVFPCAERDENYLFGLNNIISILQDQLKLC